MYFSDDNVHKEFIENEDMCLLMVMRAMPYSLLNEVGWNS